MSVTVLIGDCLEHLRAMPESSINCCITSPPYFGLRDYGMAGQIGLEPTPAEYVAKLVSVFNEVRRVLKGDGTLWLNLGDSYANDGKWGGHTGGKHVKVLHASTIGRNKRYTGLKPKDLIGIPWMVAFALRSDGWYLRQQIPWVKRNAMPESVTDRPASACETIFLLSKSQKYYYNHEAVKLPASMSFVNDPRHKTGSNGNNVKNGYESNGAQNPKGPHRMFDKQRGHSRRHSGFNERWDQMEKEEQCLGWRSTRNSDWFFEGLLTDAGGEPLAFTVNPVPYQGAHFATFPAALVEPCIRAGCPKEGTVIDPFGGSGTVGMAATHLGRNAVLIELNPDYKPLIEERCHLNELIQ